MYNNGLMVYRNTIKNFDSDTYSKNRWPARRIEKNDEETFIAILKA